MKLARLNFFDIIVASFLLVGLILLPFGMTSSLKDRAFRSSARSTPALSVMQMPISGTSGATQYSFTYSVSGKTYTAYEPGPDYSQPLSNQTVLYDPTNPSRAILASNQAGNADMALGLSAVFLSIGILIWLSRKVWRKVKRR